MPTYSCSSDRSTGYNNSSLGFSNTVIHYRADKNLSIELEQPLESSIYTNNILYTEPRNTTLRSLTIMLAIFVRLKQMFITLLILKNLWIQVDTLK